MLNSESKHAFKILEKTVIEFSVRLDKITHILLHKEQKDQTQVVTTLEGSLSNLNFLWL